MSDYSQMNMTAQRILNYAFNALVEEMCSRGPGEAEIRTHAISGGLQCEATWKSSENVMHFKLCRILDA